MSATGRGNIWFLQQNITMKAVNFLGVLMKRLLWMIRQTSVFMHDGAKCHQAKVIKDWLAAKEIEVLRSWPGNSPDLKPSIIL